MLSAREGGIFLPFFDSYFILKLFIIDIVYRVKNRYRKRTAVGMKEGGIH